MNENWNSVFADIVIRKNMRSHVGWSVERSIPCKDVETSL